MNGKETTPLLNELRAELESELLNIFNYWEKYSVDQVHGGFIGQIDENEIRYEESPKGSVLNARILWSLSAAYNLSPDPEKLKLAERSFDYISTNFVDKAYGGVYWTLDAFGKPLDTKKQIYAIAFTIYGLSEYYRASQNQAALDLAVSLFKEIEEHSFDADKGGYLEALTREWAEITDLRLSDKDANEKKTMNTHLHVLEAYTCLYSVWRDANLLKKLRGLIKVFKDHIIGENGHLKLFLDENWEVKSTQVSYGHDIEASWLLLDAAVVTRDAELIKEIEEIAVLIAEASLGGISSDGGMNYEYDPVNKHLDADKHWWVQAEAMVGFFNAWELSGSQHYLDACYKTWQFVKEYIIDQQHGEWIWGVHTDHSKITGEDKVGLWKCPYHNSRACIELINRITAIDKKQRS